MVTQRGLKQQAIVANKVAYLVTCQFLAKRNELKGHEDENGLEVAQMYGSFGQRTWRSWC